MKRRHTFRLYPNAEQQHQLSRVFGCVRVVRNAFISQMQSARKSGVTVSLSEMEKKVTTDLKRQEGYHFLSDVSAVALQQSARNTSRSFRNFFAGCQGKRPRVGYPRFAKKRGKQSASFTKAAPFHIRVPAGCRWGFLSLPKIEGEIKFRACRDIDWETVKVVTVMKHPSGMYEVSVTHDFLPDVFPSTVRACGVDLGLSSLAVIASTTGSTDVVANPRFYRSAKRSLARSQQRLSRKKKGSSNYVKAARDVARRQGRVSRQRKDHLNKLSRQLVNDNQVIGIEDLAVAALAKTRLATSVYDAGWGMFRAMLTYKTADAGRHLHVVDRFFPSTRTCSVCSVVSSKKNLDVRSWTCESCGTHLDRDINAATNILHEAVKSSEAAGHADSLNVCGGNVRLWNSRAVSVETETLRSLP